MEIKDIIRNRRIQRGMTMKQLADAIGVSEGTVSRWESGNIENMKRDKISKLSNLLSIDPRIIMGWEHNAIPPYENIEPIATKSFPLFDGIAAGIPRLMPDGVALYVNSTIEVQADFVLKVHGDSMTGARINDGDYVFIRQQPEVENGEIAAVAVGDEATLKRFYKYGDMVILHSENPNYKDIVFTGNDGQDVHVIGKAVAFQSDVI